MTILKAIKKNRLILITIVVEFGLIFLVVLFFILRLCKYIEEDVYKSINSMLGSLISLLTIIIALLLPIIIKDMDKKDEREKMLVIHQKCFDALINICNKYFEYYNQKNENAENFSKKDLVEIISSLNILNEFKKELYNLNISYFEIFQKENPNPHFKYFFIEKEIRIYMQMEYIDPINISIEKNGIKVKNINDINQILIKIKNKINF